MLSSVMPVHLNFLCISGMRTQLLGQLRAAGFVRARGGSDIRDLNTNSENWAVVKVFFISAECYFNSSYFLCI